ncbi:MAG: DUF3971 domain-containing protein, partial [Pseudomonadota bacterium]
MTLRVAPNTLSLSVYASLEDAGLKLSLDTAAGREEADIALHVENLTPSHLSESLTEQPWLAAIDAPISMNLRGTVDQSDRLLTLNGQTSAGPGRLRPTGFGAEFPFSTARSYFQFDPEKQRLTLDALTIRSPQLEVDATGHADLLRNEAKRLDEAILQLRFGRVAVDPEGVFESAAQFDSGAADIRFVPGEMRADLGQLYLQTSDADGDAASSIRITGGIAPKEAEAGQSRGWDTTMDLEVDRIRSQDLLALWPVPVANRTRAWLSQNLMDATFTNARIFLRGDGGDVETVLSYQFEDATVLAVPTLPPIRNARGFASIRGDSYAMTFDAGIVEPPEGGTLDLAGSTIRVPDLEAKPALMDVALRTAGTATATLSLLNEPPLSVLRDTGFGPDLATASVETKGTISFPLQKNLTLNEVRFDVTGTARRFTSNVLVPDHRLAADLLSLRANNSEVAVSGSAQLDDVPLTATWTQRLG